jgi:hypothetical protein
MSHASVANAIRSFLGDAPLPNVAASKWALEELDPYEQPTKCCKVNNFKTSVVDPDPGSGALLTFDPGSGMGKKS